MQLRACPAMLSTLQMYIVHGGISAQFLVEILSLGGPFALEVFKIFAYQVIFVIKLYKELLSSPSPETLAIALLCVHTRSKSLARAKNSPCHSCNRICQIGTSLSQSQL